MILKNKLLGIGLAVIIMIAAKLLSGYLPTLGTTLLALIMGVLVRQLLELQPLLFRRKKKKLESRWLLSICWDY